MRAAAVDAHAVGREHALTLYEAAFLSGGPRRVADLRWSPWRASAGCCSRTPAGRPSWAVRAGRDGRSVIGAIGPGGRSRIAPVRATAATADPVRALADRLVGAGLAVPDGARVRRRVRRVRVAAVAVCALGAAALVLPLPADQPRR
ncbi:TIGR04222 domain-containing membrane protein [Streptomyces thinghirensis]|nr:TIGR04222 domain-containing membrane protein [Streptomyces thinghirensis]